MAEEDVIEGVDLEDYTVTASNDVVVTPNDDDLLAVDPVEKWYQTEKRDANGDLETVLGVQVKLRTFDQNLAVEAV